MRKMKLGVVWVCLAGLTLAPADAAPRPEVHALTGVRIVVAPGQEIEQGTVVLRDGVIEAVGAEVEVPGDARLWEHDGLTVYAGWIEPYSLASWPDSDDEDAMPQGGHANSLVTPQRDMTFYAFDAGRARKLREAGFTTTLVAPKDGLFRGQSVLLNLGDGALQSNLLRRHVAQHVALAATHDDGYPGSLMGSIALSRQTFLDARWYRDAQQALDDNPAQGRPPFDLALEALGPVVDGQQAVIFENDDMLATLRAAKVIEEFALQAWVVGSGDEYKRLDAIAATGLPILLPLNFPDKPTVGEDDDLTLDIDELRHWDAAPDNPVRLADAEVTFALTSHGLSEPKKIHQHLATAIERGLDPAAALAAATTTPARLLGLSDRLGTVEVGKIANLMVVEGDLLSAKPKIREVWVDGKRYEVKESKPPEVDPVGSWDLVIDAGPGGKIPVVLVIEGEIEDLSGTIGSSAGALTLESVEVSGKSVEISFDSTPFGMPGKIQFKLNLDGDSATGNGTSPQGPFRLSGQRSSKGDPEVES